ncbi:TRAP transporter large permease [Kerstersia gyiorum]|jgi:tripartite ATP-independent transporter DctM subunit|uniref:TRAP transporter large permease n=1 Tax=Kerstersia gyiorum TaxID=206506 RepID=UPI000FD8F403|nr:TRAP transporter large permease [Kerstersia gyiorum]AZV93495.1 C4-dicarboxylate ABC transporter permease [Bordetella sp. J329]MCH4273127.1 TRAP transporter large permease [Kerstersia gyiorum]MCI1228464.1 TRAP transporter large permease [Kerstersia gyiorum]MCP1635619.1 tripartite ATP-independent transporter DctM subunit [Kerstersia gyiorum]MCP1670974.1 tripartite ATP-independent transporter DctM subunit [Kerstersia gyiorum]
MSGTTVGLLIGLLMMLFLALRMHIGIAMFIAGGLGYWWISGWEPLLAHLKHAPYSRFSVYDLSVVPLFLLMGQFATQGGLSQALFRAGAAFLGHRRGGMAMAGIASCAGFGAICGSSLATAATMSHVVLPELKRHHYKPSLAGASLAVGGTLGMLIPPSVPLVIYAILAEQNIAKVFMAAFLPALLAVLGYIAVVALVCWRDPAAGGPGQPRASWRDRFGTLLATWPVLLIFAVVLGGIYGGLFTPTEAAAIGAIATGLAAWRAGGLAGGGLLRSLLGTAQGTGMMFLILLGADMLNAFLAVSQVPVEFANWVQGLGLAPFSVLIAIIVIYVLLGCVMDSLSMILLTIPIFLPIVMGMDYWGLGNDEKAIWFGMLALVVMEIGLITPPVGMNVFIIHSMAKDISPGTIFRGIMPFLLSDFVRIALLVLFPGISLAVVRWLG